MKLLFLISFIFFSSLTVVNAIPIPRNVHATAASSKDSLYWKECNSNDFKPVGLNHCEEGFSIGNAAAEIVRHKIPHRSVFDG
jgi:hypothetical protein